MLSPWLAICKKAPPRPVGRELVPPFAYPTIGRSHRHVNSHVKEVMMPYNTVADLPKAQTDQYNPHQKEAFLKAFNSAYKEYGGDEGRAFAVAHTAAKRAGEKPGPG
jgi:cation transport regulator